MKKIAFAFVVLSIVLFNIPSARASEENSTSGNNHFQFIVAPYAWLTGLNASIGLGSITTNVNSPLIKSSEKSGIDLNAAFLGQAEVVYNDTVGLLANINYASLKGKFNVDNFSINGDTSFLMSDVLPYYRFGNWDLNQSKSCKITVDGLAGVRIWDISVASLNKNWVDPLIGSRVALQLYENWILTLRGAIGGFGISSAFTWDINATVGYEFYKHCALVVGYRAVGINRNEGDGLESLKLKGTIHGPIVGMSFSF
jgi:hypothetical protein